MRLKLPFRYALYAIVAFLTLTGAAWFVADWQKDLSTDEMWQQIAANMLMLHGGAAMLALLLLGALIPLHIQRAWRAGKNKISGSLMATLNATLIVTAFGLYYLGSETLRPWISWTHIAAGSALALWLPLHIWLGRRDAH